MKNRIALIAGILLVGIFLVSIASACNSDPHRTYNDRQENNLDTNDGVIFIVYDNQYHGSSVYQSENVDRHPVSDYAYGYTYRASQEYYSDRIYDLERNSYYGSRFYQNNHFGPNWLFDGNNDYVLFQERPNYFYLYNENTDSYEKHSCYVNPPSDKLVYVKCP